MSHDEEVNEPLLEEDTEINELGCSQTTAILSTLNVFVGLGLLTMPYAFSVAGWFAIILLPLTTAGFLTSALLLLTAITRLPIGTPHTYMDLGTACAGKTGRSIVLLLALMELCGGAVVVLLVFFNQLHILLPLLPATHILAISALLLTPILCIDGGISKLSKISFLGFSSSIVVALALAALALSTFIHNITTTKTITHTTEIVHWGGLFPALGLFAVSSSAHSALPALRQCMKRPQQFPSVLIYCFAIMTIVYTIVGMLGYMLWGDEAKELLTVNLDEDAPRLVSQVLVTLILLACYAKFPVLIMVIQGYLQTSFRNKKRRDETSPPPLERTTAASSSCSPSLLSSLKGGVGISLRLCIGSTTFLVAAIGREKCGNIMSLVGGLGSIACSLVLPVVCFSILGWQRCSLWERLGLSVFIIVSLTIAALVTGQNVHNLLHVHG
jgi:solute carrier family 32 (vesicular inhibitory amino acid transporter)